MVRFSRNATASRQDHHEQTEVEIRLGVDELGQHRGLRDPLRPGHARSVSRRITGSREFTIQRTANRPMLFNMMVLITSWAPVLARSTPGMPPHRKPPAARPGG